MRIPDSIFEELTRLNIYEENPTILLWDIPDEKTIKKLGFNENSRFLVGARGIHSNVPIKSRFEILFSLHEPENFIEVDARLETVKINPKYEIDNLPDGYSAVCLISFNSSPSILNKLKPYSVLMDYQKYDVLYLTQRPVIKKIIELLK